MSNNQLAILSDKNKTKRLTVSDRHIRMLQDLDPKTLNPQTIRDRYSEEEIEGVLGSLKFLRSRIFHIEQQFEGAASPY